MKFPSRPLIRFGLATIAIALIGAGPAVAETLERVLARHADAVGAPAAIEGTRSLRFVGRARGLDQVGTFETIAVGPDSLSQHLELGVIRQRTVLAGASAWTLDRNGMVRDLDGRERRVLTTEAWLSSLAYLKSPSPTSPAATNYLQLIDSGSEEIGLVFTPPAGHRRVIFLDPVTARVTRMIERQDSDTLTVVYGDYREVDGLTLPFRVRQTTGDPAFDIVIEADRIERNPRIDPAEFLPPAAPTADFRFDGPTPTLDVPIRDWGGHLLVSVLVNGNGPHQFFLDTGAGATCIDEALARRLGLRTEGAVQAQGVTGTATVSFVTIDSMEVGSVTLLGQRVVAIPLSELPLGLEGGLGGILGYDFFSRFVVSIDYARERLAIYPFGGFEPSPRCAVIPIALENNIPSVEGTVNGSLRGSFRIDTGSNAALDLHGPFVQEHRLVQTAKNTTRRPSAGIGGTELGVVARLDSFRLGPYLIAEPIVGLSEATVGAFASTNYAGNIGAGILSTFTVTFDYASRIMYLEPNDRFGRRDVFDRSGLAFWSTAAGREAIHVEPDTPAWRAGIRPGDRILAVNGRSSRSWTDLDLSEVFRGEPGTPVSVRIKREGRIRTVRFRLDEIL